VRNLGILTTPYGLFRLWKNRERPVMNAFTSREEMLGQWSKEKHVSERAGAGSV